MAIVAEITKTEIPSTPSWTVNVPSIFRKSSATGEVNGKIDKTRAARSGVVAKKDDINKNGAIKNRITTEKKLFASLAVGTAALIPTSNPVNIINPAIKVMIPIVIGQNSHLILARIGVISGIFKVLRAKKNPVIVGKNRIKI